MSLKITLEGFQWAVGVGERILQMLEGVCVIIDITRHWRGLFAT